MNIHNKRLLLISLLVSVLCLNTTQASDLTQGQSAKGKNIANIVGDVIIVGGGTGGLTAAYELATKSKLNVHVLEAGDDPTSYNPDIKVPLKFFNVSLNPNNEWGFVSTPQVNAGNAVISLARFKGLGGCSQHNGAGFWLASKSVYDTWPEGFKYKDFNREAREFEGCADFGPPNHGTCGPLYTELDDLDLIDPYLKAWKRAALQAGYPFNPDENAPAATGYMPHIVTIKDGERYGPYEVFKTVMGKLPNLHVHLKTTVTKILFDGKDRNGNLKIKGVEADKIDSNGVQQKVRFLAAKAVVLAAGAFQTPQILMVSGIGDRDVLNAAAINVKLHLPGVGKSLKDHYATLFVSNTTKIPPMNDPAFFEKQAALYAATRKGYFGHSPTNQVVRTSSTGNRRDASIPADLALLTAVYTFVPGFAPNQILSVVSLPDPKSSGTVTVSSDSVYDPPVIDMNYYADSDDFDVMYKGFDLMREIFSKPALSPWFDTELFPNGAPNITIKSQVLTTAHPMGTCMIGYKHEEFAVVDNNGAVFGTSGLYVADASAIRTAPGSTPDASPHGTVILLAKIVADNLLNTFCS